MANVTITMYEIILNFVSTTPLIFHIAPIDDIIIINITIIQSFTFCFFIILKVNYNLVLA